MSKRKLKRDLEGMRSRDDEELNSDESEDEGREAGAE